MGEAHNGLRQVAARIAGGADLVDVRMHKASFENFDFPDRDSPLSFDLNIEPSAQYDSDSHVVVVSADFQVEVTQKQGNADDDATLIARIEFTFGGLFDVPSETSYEEREVEAFAATTGIFGLYPYAREYVRDATGRMGLPPLTLGTYRVPAEAD